MSTNKVRGTHIHPGRDRTQHGYPHPKKRDPNKVWKYPNVRLKAGKGDYHMGPLVNGLWEWKVPYPPRINATADPWPRLDKSNLYGKKPPLEYPMKWKNIEYKMIPQLARKPHAGINRWKFNITRIVHGKEKE